MFRATCALSCLLLASACGGKVIFDGGGGSGGSGVATSSHASTSASKAAANGSTGSAGLSRTNVSFDFAQTTGECTTASQCDIVGKLADGRSLRESCTISGKNGQCALLVDGAEICTCPANRIDWSTTCSNGIPTCTGWLIDYAHVTGCPTK